MSNFLVGQNLVDPKWKNHGTGGGTSFTLDYNGTTGSTLLFIGGAIQVPGTDFTVSGTTLTTSTSVTAGIEVITCQMFKAGTVNVPADASVDGTKIALSSQAAGDIMYYNGTAWVRLAKGTASQLLAMNSGATAPEWVAPAPGGGWELIASTSDLSSGSPTQHTWTGLGGYDAYRIIFKDVRTNTAQICWLRVGTGGTINSGATYSQTGFNAVARNAYVNQWTLSVTAPHVSYYGTNVTIHWEIAAKDEAEMHVYNYTGWTGTAEANASLGYASTLPFDCIQLLNAGSQPFFGGSAYIFGRMNV